MNSTYRYLRRIGSLYRFLRRTRAIVHHERLDRVARREQALGFVPGKLLVEYVNEATLFTDRIDYGKRSQFVDVDRRTHDGREFDSRI